MTHISVSALAIIITGKRLPGRLSVSELLGIKDGSLTPCRKSCFDEECIFSGNLDDDLSVRGGKLVDCPECIKFMKSKGL